MKYSNQEWYCNNCGQKQWSSPIKGFGAGCRSRYVLCSIKCAREMNWKDILSNFNKEYYPQPEEKA